MGIILSIIFFFMAYIAYNVEQKSVSPTFIFTILWGVIMFAEGLHLFGLYESNLITYCVIATGVIAFAVGSLLCRRVVLIAGNRTVYEIRMSLFFFLMTSTVLLLLVPAFSTFSLLLSGELDMAEIRLTFENPYTSTILRLLYNYVAAPFSIACLPLVSMILMTDQSKFNKCISFLLTVIVIMERILLDAGRGILLYFFVMLFFVYKLFGNKQQLNLRKYKRMIFIMAVTVASLYIMISSFRGGGLQGFGKQVYTYICGCVPFLDINLQVVDQEKVVLFGAGGLRGPLQFIFTMLENIGLADYPEFMSQSDVWYNNSLIARQIAPSTTFNAYATCFYNVYLDGGIIAVFFEMLLYGAFARCIFNMTEFQPNNYRIKAIYVFVIYGLVFSFIRFQFSYIRNFLCFVFIIIVVGGTRLSDENRSN